MPAWFVWVAFNRIKALELWDEDPDGSVTFLLSFSAKAVYDT